MSSKVSRVDVVLSLLEAISRSGCSALEFPRLIEFSCGATHKLARSQTWESALAPDPEEIPVPTDVAGPQSHPCSSGLVDVPRLVNLKAEREHGEVVQITNTTCPVFLVLDGLSHRDLCPIASLIACRKRSVAQYSQLQTV